MLDYTWRVRDLVHGTILFTKEEQRVIESPLFQRLRNIRQNDLTGTVFPSMNTTRFEHVLGACHVAGRMAEQLIRSPSWTAYQADLREKHPFFQHMTHSSTAQQFIRVARLYALLHDVGHFPLSHLFEDALTRYAVVKGIQVEALMDQWFGIGGYTKPHEALGAHLMQYFRDIFYGAEAPMLHLMTEKELNPLDPLNIIKKIVDSEIDADRIDAVRRDGIMAGGEYGTYDINRLCTSALIVRPHDRLWDIAFSDIATTSLESLLLDRYRIYFWVHLHHLAVEVKACAVRLIERALQEEKICQKHFTGTQEELALRDDIWLMTVLRDHKAGDDETFRLLQKVVFFHSREPVAQMWKRRARYLNLTRRVQQGIKQQLGARQKGSINLDVKDTTGYEQFLTERLGMPVLYYPTHFQPVDINKKVHLFSSIHSSLRKETLSDISKLVKSLNEIWKRGDIQDFVMLISPDIGRRMMELQERNEHGDKWVQAAIAYHLARLSV